MKVFLAGAVSSADKKQLEKYNLYRKIITDCIKDVELTVPDDIWEYRMTCKQEKPKASKTEIDKMMVDYDLQCVRDSDLVICDLSSLSTGMGLELGVAHERGKRVIFCYEKGTSISNMITGAYSSSTFIEYSDLKQLSIKLREFLKQGESLTKE